MSEEEKAADPFEENLRHILSNGGTQVSEGTASAAAPPRPAAVVPDEEAINRMKAEQRTLFVFKVLRPIAAAAFLGALAFFVMRITGER